MGNYIFVLVPEDPDVLNVLMETSESIFDHLGAISADLERRNYTGSVRFDELLHSGVNRRFIRAWFDGHAFGEKSFAFEELPADSRIPSIMEWFLRSSPDALKYSVLTSWEQEAILAGKSLSEAENPYESDFCLPRKGE